MLKPEIDRFISFSERFTDYISTVKERSYEKYPDKIKELSEFRKIPVETLLEADVFYVGSEAELVHPSYIENLVDFGIISPTNNMPIYSDRYVFPIKDMQGNVLSHVGYRAKAAERYIYGTAKYYSRLNDLYGLENMPFAFNEGYAIVTEGITDALAFRGIGYKNAFAWCGVRKSSYKNLLLNRLRYGIIKVNDNDASGRRTIPLWDFDRSFLIKTPVIFKDTAQAFEKPEWREHYKNCLPVIVDCLKSTYGDGRLYKDYIVEI